MIIIIFFHFGCGKIIYFIETDLKISAGSYALEGKSSKLSPEVITYILLNNEKLKINKLLFTNIDTITIGNGEKMNIEKIKSITDTFMLKKIYSRVSAVDISYIKDSIISNYYVKLNSNFMNDDIKNRSRKIPFYSTLTLYQAKPYNNFRYKDSIFKRLNYSTYQYAKKIFNTIIFPE